MLIIEKGVAGGTPLHTERIENYPGFPDGISGRELMERIVEQGRRLGLAIKEFSPVAKIVKNGERFAVSTGNGAFESLGLIVATGNCAEGWCARRGGVSGAGRLLLCHVRWLVFCRSGRRSDRRRRRRHRGGTDTREPRAQSVRSSSPRPAPGPTDRLQERAFKTGKMEFLWNKIPLRITGSDAVESIVLEDTIDDRITEVPVSAVFVYVGSRADTSFLGELVGA